MNAEIIAVGTELLLGNIVNTNAQYLSHRLATLGIGMYFQTVVGDNADRLYNAYEIAFSRADLIITSGGLGPTEDDLTKEVGAKYFNRQLETDDESLVAIESIFKTQGFDMPESNKKQALIPQGATVLKNNNGTAPGIFIEENGKLLFMLPGPPSELIPLFEESVYPILKQRQNCVFASKTLKICGIGESAAETMIKDLIDSQSNPSIATYAKISECSIRLTASAETDEKAFELIAPIKDEIYSRFNENIYGEDDETLESVIANILMRSNLKIAVAESCTGGMLTAKFVDFPGISHVLTEGIVSYSNEAKMKRLEVNAETLEKFGAVSAETAVEMAIGAAKTSGANIAISTTGIAGPDGGTDQKPVGLVYVGLYIDGQTNHRQFQFKGDRTKIRVRTTVSALDFLRRELIKAYGR